MPFNGMRSRRKVLKTASVVTVAGMAGCMGGEDGGDGSDGGDGGDDGDGGGATSTPSEDDSVDLPDPQEVGEEAYAEEWRRVASEKAAEELDGERIRHFTTVRESGYWRETVINNDYSGVYAPLKGKIEVISGRTGTQQQRYRQEAMSGGTMSIDNISFPFLKLGFGENAVPFMDLTGIPSYRQNPDNVKFTDWCGSSHIYGYNINYNTERVDQPPETYEDILDDRFKGEILVDFTPPALIAGAAVSLFDEQWFEDLQAQDVTYIKSGWDTTKRLGQGEGKVTLWDQAHHALRASNRDLPVETLVSTETPMWLTKPLGAAARPLHPWASKLYIDFMMHPDHDEFQAYRPTGVISLDGELTNPPGWPLADALTGQSKIWSIGDFDKGLNELTREYQDLIGAPV